MKTYNDLKKAALDAAIWITASPHEWVWTQEQQEAMARYCLEAAKRLSLWRWLTDMHCTVQQDSALDKPPFVVVDVDNELLGRGSTPEEAIIAAQRQCNPAVSTVHLLD